MCFKYPFHASVLFTLMLCGYGCDFQKDSGPSVTIAQVAVTPKALFQEPIVTQSFELASGALTVWRRYSAAKPALLLFAAHPLLNPVPEPLTEQVGQLLSSRDDTELLRRGTSTAADALLISPQTVSAAIEGGLISELLVVLPSLDDKPISLEKFSKRASAAGFFSSEDASRLTLEDGVIRGSTRGIPLRVSYLNALPEIDRPLLMHIDLSYFKESYVNDIKTPIYDLIYEFATATKGAGYRPTAVTLSYSNQEVDISLSSRFVINDLATLIENPAYLEGGTPASWALRASALYASLMFDEERSRILTEQAAASTPDDAAALFDLALVRFQENLPEEGFALLEQAIALDAGYGLVYLDLADQGQNLEQWTKSFELLEKATTIFPDNAVLRIRLAGDLIQRGRVKEARRVLKALEKLEWSEFYHPEARALLEKMQQAAKVESVLPLAETRPVPSGKPRSRTLPPSHMGMPPQ